jgi:hypothetical protein
MTTFTSFDTKVTDLLSKRGMIPSVGTGIKHFVDYFRAFSWYAHTIHGDGDNMLDILLDDNNLISNVILDSNFLKPLAKFYPSALSNNNSWKYLFETLLRYTPKGVGVGELCFPLIIQGWSCIGNGDGTLFRAGEILRLELKKNGASLKPNREILRVQKELNRRVFEGHRAGPARNFKQHRDWIKTKPSAETIYLEYFPNLWRDFKDSPDVEHMCKRLATIDDCKMFYNVIGTTVLKQYKQIDGWYSLIVIDPTKMFIANLVDISDIGLQIFGDKLGFRWISDSGKDTQAVSDGYVNITFKE